MATRLKRLDLHGFKSFATPTTFVFDTGITAVIGPNGSGKSNISDGLRWVLGEQSYANLRGKRTEDIIFAGSAARTPLGMAEVTVTLDNEDGSLPVDFSEVSVTRRAYRSGENHYLINGARVRLKDVLQVTASLGQSHTVIGQGLVDAILSQRVDERRSLFEHAAGITGLRIKHASAGRNLEESQTNCVRLEDLLADLEPRLRSLERAARQAREYDDVKRQLRDSLERFYSHHWQQARERLQESTNAVNRLNREIETAKETRSIHRQALSLASEAARSLTTDLESLRQSIQRSRDEQQQAAHELDLIAERRRAAQHRRNDAEQSLRGVEGSIEELSAEIEQNTVLAQKLNNVTAEREALLRDLEGAFNASRRRLTDLESRLKAEEQRRSEIERSLMLTESRETLILGQIEQLLAERERRDRATSERDRARSNLESAQAGTIQSLSDASNRFDELTDRLKTLLAEIAAVTGERDNVSKRRSQLERKVLETTTRFETLRRLAESGVGLYAGVKQVLAAARSEKLTGILGTLASLLIVPAELEAAIEAALGGHLQDLVVDRWEDAETAIEYLKRTQSGRATFHPLDTVQPRRQTSAPRLTPGVRGLAAELIGVDERVRPVIDGLLGRVLVAEDLDAARIALRSLPPGWSVVTIGGEIARSSGTVTGGSRIKETGALARERELRELPKLRTRLETERDEITQQMDRCDESLRVHHREKSSLEQELADVRGEVRDLTAARDRQSRELAELERSSEAEDDRLTVLDDEAEKRQRELEELLRAKQRQHGSLDEVGRTCARLRDEIRSMSETIDESALLTARSELSGLRERERGIDEQRHRLEARKRQLEGDLSAGDRRLTELDEAIQNLDREHNARTTESDRLSSETDGLNAQLHDVQERHREAVQREGAAREALETAETVNRELERRQDHLSLEAARRRDELDLTLERAGRDLETDHIEEILSSTDAANAEDLPRIERDIGRLRERLRRIGVAGDDAIEQYEREAERFAFLRQQLDDVRSATDALRALMTELDRTMSLEFDRTFAEVARAFESTFTSLFGGGRARLIRCDDESGSTGIDIEAQPPGKRLQNLGLLSGGERALTAVALLFSILKVNPSPFCLLDEVDAALDESNVVRVRDELQRLAIKTQFVVVTHNRSTIEGADTLYGITMGDDGISRVLSLKMPVEPANEPSAALR